MGKNGSNLIYFFLCSLKIRINFLHIQEVYNKHSLPHSIRALSDTLDELQVDNIVCQPEFHQLIKIDSPFIVVTSNNAYPFYLVEKFDKNNKIILLRSASGQKRIQTFFEFQKNWQGIVLLAEKGTNIKEDPPGIYYLKQVLWHIHRTEAYWITALTAYLLLWKIIQNPSFQDFRYLIKIVGVIVSLLTVIKATFQPQIIQRFCHIGQHSDCNEVFKSPGAKLMNWVSLGELSLTYFASSVLWGIFIAQNPEILFILLDALALLFVIYSFIWQFIHHQWCSLCLIIDIIIITDFLFEILHKIKIKNWLQQAEFSPEILSYITMFTLCLLIIKKTVEIIEQNCTIPQWKFKHEKLLNTPDIFWQLLARQPKEKVDINKVPTISNSLNSEHNITIIINPSCPKCAKVHNIITSIEGYCIHLVFFVNNKDLKSYNAAIKLISYGINNTWENTNQFINSWYEKQETLVNTEITPQAKNILEAQLNYCKKIKTTGTPIILIDNCQTPQAFEVEDLKVIL